MDLCRRALERSSEDDDGLAHYLDSFALALRHAWARIFARELEVLNHRFAPTSPRVLIDTGATIANGLDALRKHSCVHLTCHGTQHRSALQSCFALTTKTLELHTSSITPRSPRLPVSMSDGCR